MSKLLEVKNLEVNFKVYSGKVHAIRDVSFSIDRGETLALVGESGSGKSVTSKSIMQLLPKSNTEISGGEIIFNGENLLEYNEKQMRDIRGNDIAMIFQNPMTSLNPVMKIGKQITESITLHQNLNKKDAKNEALK